MTEFTQILKNEENKSEYIFNQSSLIWSKIEEESEWILPISQVDALELGDLAKCMKDIFISMWTFVYKLIRVNDIMQIYLHPISNEE